MTEAMEKAVDEWRRKGVNISEENAGRVEAFCRRKMEVSGMQPDKSYFEILFRCEVENFVIRWAINARSVLLEEERKARKDVFNLSADTLPPAMPERGTAEAGSRVRQMRGGNIRGGSFLRLSGRPGVRGMHRGYDGEGSIGNAGRVYERGIGRRQRWKKNR